MGKGFSKGIILVLHYKIIYISSCSAAEAVIHLLGRGYGEGRRLLIMKRTQTKIGASLSGQSHILGYHIYNIIFHTYFFNDIVRITHAYPPFLFLIVTVHFVPNNTLRDAQKSCFAWFRAALLGFSVNFVHQTDMSPAGDITIYESQLFRAYGRSHSCRPHS